MAPIATSETTVTALFKYYHSDRSRFYPAIDSATAYAVRVHRSEKPPATEPFGVPVSRSGVLEAPPGCLTVGGGRVCWNKSTLDVQNDRRARGARSGSSPDLCYRSPPHYPDTYRARGVHIGVSTPGYPDSRGRDVEETPRG